MSSSLVMHGATSVSRAANDNCEAPCREMGGDEANSVHLHTEGALLLLQEIAASHPALFLSSFRETGIAHGRELAPPQKWREEVSATQLE